MKQLIAPILADTTSGTGAATPFLALFIIVLWTLTRKPSPGSTKQRDMWSGLAAWFFGPFGFWVKKRWRDGFTWLGIWLLILVPLSFIYISAPPGRGIVAAALIACILAYVVLLIITMIRVVRAPYGAQAQPPPLPAQFIVAKALDEKQRTSAAPAVHQAESKPPQQNAWLKGKQAKALGVLVGLLIVASMSILVLIALMVATTTQSPVTHRLAPLPDAKPNTYHVANCEELGLLMEPDYKSPILGRLGRGLSGIIAVGDVIENGSTRWQRVVTPAGRQGWVDSAFLLPDQEKTTPDDADDADEADEPDALPATAAAALPRATPNQGLGDRMTLPKVKLNTYHVDKCDMLNVRTEPDSKSQIVARLQRGISGIITFGDVVANGSTQWRKVITPAGGQGWANIEFLVPDQDSAER